jgi:hypothetical protein
MYKAKQEGGKLYLYKDSEQVGLISPKAIWVKEGDEFDEEDTKKVCVLGENHCVEWIEGREEKGYKPSFLIKCPTCKKFH